MVERHYRHIVPRDQHEQPYAVLDPMPRKNSAKVMGFCFFYVS